MRGLRPCFSLWFTDFGSRVLNRVDFIECSLRRASFSDAVLRSVGFHTCDLAEADFRGSTAEVVILDHEARVFGTHDAMRALAARGAITDLIEAQQEVRLAEEWQQSVKKIVKGRFRRFYVPGPSDKPGSRWDVSIKDRNLLGGLGQAERTFVSSQVIPEMIGLGLITRDREHGEVIYRITDMARDEARALIERDDEVGAVGRLIERLSS